MLSFGLIWSSFQCTLLYVAEATHIIVILVSWFWLRNLSSFKGVLKGLRIQGFHCILISLMQVVLSGCKIQHLLMHILLLVAQLAGWKYIFKSTYTFTMCYHQTLNIDGHLFVYRMESTKQLVGNLVMKRLTTMEVLLVWGELVYPLILWGELFSVDR